MNIWEALETLCGERNPHLFVMIEIEDAQQIVAMRKAFLDILKNPTEKRMVAAKKMMAEK